MTELVKELNACASKSPSISLSQEPHFIVKTLHEGCHCCLSSKYVSFQSPMKCNVRLSCIISSGLERISHSVLMLHRSGLGSLEMFSMGLKATGSYVSRQAFPETHTKFCVKLYGHFISMHDKPCLFGPTMHFKKKSLSFKLCTICITGELFALLRTHASANAAI